MQAMGLCSFFAQTFDLVLLIRIEVTFEPMPIARVFIGTLPRKNMRGNAVEEHTVVADDHGDESLQGQAQALVAAEGDRP